MTPYFEGSEHGEQFLVMDILVEFRQGKGLRVESDQMNFIVGWRYSGKDGGEGMV